MTRKNDKQSVPELKALMTQNQDLLQPLVQWLLQEVLEQEMTDSIGAAKGERCEGRQSYRSGYYPRRLVTRVGTMELRVPQDRQGRFFLAPKLCLGMPLGGKLCFPRRGCPRVGGSVLHNCGRILPADTPAWEAELPSQVRTRGNEGNRPLSFGLALTCLADGCFHATRPSLAYERPTRMRAPRCAISSGTMRVTSRRARGFSRRADSEQVAELHPLCLQIFRVVGIWLRFDGDDFRDF